MVYRKGVAPILDRVGANVDAEFVTAMVATAFTLGLFALVYLMLLYISHRIRESRLNDRVRSLEAEIERLKGNKEGE